MSDLYVIGAGGHGMVVAEIAQAMGLSIAGFIDDDPTKAEKQVLQWKVLGGMAQISPGSLSCSWDRE